MAISVYINPVSATAAQYDEIIRRLDAAGAGKPAGRLYHACFGSGDKLQVFDIWESQQAFDKFGETMRQSSRKSASILASPWSSRFTT